MDIFVPNDWFDDDDDEYFEDEDPYGPYPDDDIYCLHCGEVLSSVVDENGQHDLCNHCGYTARRTTGG